MQQVADNPPAPPPAPVAPPAANIPDIITKPPPVEKQVFIWNIRNFSKVLTSLRRDISGCPLYTQFDAGSSLGLLSTWRLTITLSNACLPDRFTKWFVRIDRVGGSPNATYFGCKVSIKDRAGNNPDLDLFRIELHRKQLSKMFGRLGQMQDRTIEDELEIYVKFDLWPNNDPVAVDGITNNLYLLRSGEDADALIKVTDGEETTDIKVHLRILAVSCPLLHQALLDSGGTLTISDLSLASIKILLQYLYTGNFDHSWKTVAQDLLQAAARYGLFSVLEYFDRNLHLICTTANAQGLRRLAKLHGLTNATKKITAFIISHLDQIDL